MDENYLSREFLNMYVFFRNDDKYDVSYVY